MPSVREEFHRARPKSRRLTEDLDRAWVTTAPEAYDYDLVTRGEILGSRRDGRDSFQVIRFVVSPEATDYRIQYQLDRYRSGSHFVCSLEDWGQYEYMVEAKLREAKLRPNDRQSANANLRVSGMDGNINFETPGQGFNAISAALEKHGIEMVDLFPPIASDPMTPYPDGHTETHRLRVALSHPRDPFSPDEIDNSILHMTVFKKREGAWEIVAYLS